MDDWLGRLKTCESGIGNQMSLRVPLQCDQKKKGMILHNSKVIVLQLEEWLPPLVNSAWPMPEVVFFA
jgi:hypothetical protein